MNRLLDRLDGLPVYLLWGERVRGWGGVQGGSHGLAAGCMQ